MGQHSIGTELGLGPWTGIIPPNAGPPPAMLAAATWFEHAFSAAPALMIGLAALAVIPVLIVAGALVRRRAERSQANSGPSTDGHDAAGRTVRVAKNTEIRVMREQPDERGIATQALRSPPRPMGGVITVVMDGESPPQGLPAGRRLEFGRTTLMRIGREPDNELVLSEPTVHRYHAAIERTLDAGYVITDLSGDKGNGVLVNGRRITEAQLGDRDEIKLGAAILEFSLCKQ